MRKLLRRLLTKPVLSLSNRYSSKPDRQRIFAALSDLLSRILNGEKKKGLVVPFDIKTGKYIIFSDQHKGACNGADDFMVCEERYLAALDYYYAQGFHYIALGDCEEIGGNFVDTLVRWKGKSDLSALRGQPVSLHFTARGTKLYAFQFTP